MASIRLYDKNGTYTEYFSDDADFQRLYSRAKIQRDLNNRDKSELAPWTVKYSTTQVCPVCGKSKTIGGF